MGLKKHYKITKRRNLKPYFKLVILFLMLFTCSQTFARYTYTSTDNGIVSIAKWNIVINGEQITNATTGLIGNMQLLNSADDTTSIDSGDECYFDITINPATTEVAITYSVSIDLGQTNLPSGTQILRYEKYVNTGVNEELSLTQNVNSETLDISENIALPESSTALNNTSIRRYRVYCKIPFPADMSKDTAFTVTPTITVNQYMN